MLNASLLIALQTKVILFKVSVVVQKWAFVCVDFRPVLSLRVFLVFVGETIVFPNVCKRYISARLGKLWTVRSYLLSFSCFHETNFSCFAGAEFPTGCSIVVARVLLLH